MKARSDWLKDVLNKQRQKEIDFNASVLNACACFGFKKEDVELKRTIEKAVIGDPSRQTIVELGLLVADNKLLKEYVDIILFVSDRYEANGLKADGKSIVLAANNRLVMLVEDEKRKLLEKQMKIIVLTAERQK